MKYKRITAAILCSTLMLGGCSVFQKNTTAIDDKYRTNYEIFVATSHHLEPSQPDKSRFRKALFWDTDLESLDWQRNSEWIIQRVFEYGNESEIGETIRYYGKRKITKVLEGIKDSWNSENRNKNIQKYLGHEIEN